MSMRVRGLLIAPPIMACVTCAIACAHPGQVAPKTQVPSVAAPAPATLAAPAPAPAPGGTERTAGTEPIPSGRVDFVAQVQPILEARCRPCHFAGGSLYARLPFDRAETILALREKLFTRIKNETEQRTIREFLALHPGSSTALRRR